MTYTWVLVEDGQIVCGFTQKPTEDEMLDTINAVTGYEGKFLDRLTESTWVWAYEEMTTEVSLFQTELIW
jgi:hypothetical protein